MKKISALLGTLIALSAYAMESPIPDAYHVLYCSQKSDQSIIATTVGLNNFFYRVRSDEGNTTSEIFRADNTPRPVLSPKGCFVACVRKNNLVIFDPIFKKNLSTIPLSFEPSTLSWPQSNALFIANQSNYELYKIGIMGQLLTFQKGLFHTSPTSTPSLLSDDLCIYAKSSHEIVFDTLSTQSQKTIYKFSGNIADCAQADDFFGCIEGNTIHLLNTITMTWSSLPASIDSPQILALHKDNKKLYCATAQQHAPYSVELFEYVPYEDIYKAYIAQAPKPLMQLFWRKTVKKSVIGIDTAGNSVTLDAEDIFEEKSAD
jgi:hypothetical protein